MLEMLSHARVELASSPGPPMDRQWQRNVCAWHWKGLGTRLRVELLMRPLPCVSALIIVTLQVSMAQLLKYREHACALFYP